MLLVLCPVRCWKPPRCPPTASILSPLHETNPPPGPGPLFPLDLSIFNPSHTSPFDGSLLSYNTDSKKKNILYSHRSLVGPHDLVLILTITSQMDWSASPCPCFTLEEEEAQKT